MAISDNVVRAGLTSKHKDHLPGGSLVLPAAALTLQLSMGNLIGNWGPTWNALKNVRKSSLGDVLPRRWILDDFIA